MKLIHFPLLLTLLSILPTSLLSSQTLVERKDGGNVVGEVIEERNDSLFVRLTEGEVVGVAGDSIVYMGPVAKKSTIGQYYPVIGIVAGTPGLLNFIAGFYTPFLSLRFGGMPMDIVTGYQLDLGYPFVRKADFSFDIFGSYGKANLGELDDNRDREYLGLGGSIRFYVGFLSLGARYDLLGEDVSAMAQLGVLIEFTQ